MQCNYDLKLIQNLKISDFYKEFFSIWINDFRGGLRNENPEILWNNKNILIDSKSVFYKEFQNIGIQNIEDIFVTQSVTLSFSYWKEKGLNKNAYLKYCGLWSATLQVYKQFRPTAEQDTLPQNENDPNDLLTITTRDSKKIEIKPFFKAKHFYKLLMNSSKIIWPTCANKLKHDFSLKDKEELSSLYNLTYKITKDTKLRDFQYRVINFIYNTNDLLKKKKIKENSNCDFCGLVTETLYHLFYDCNVINNFWKKVADYWNKESNIQSSLEKKDIILGNPNYPDMLNLMILIAKFCIHRCKINNRKPSLKEFIRALRNTYELEKIISDKNNKENILNKRWIFEP